MKKPTAPDTRLYNQIVYQLLAVAVLVGIVATMATVYFLDGLTSRWVAEEAEHSTQGVAFRAVEFGRLMQREARLAASDSRMREAAEREEVQLLRASVVAQNASLEFDTMMVLDSTGRVIAVSGSPDVAYGTRPFGGRGEWGVGGPRLMFSRIGGHLAITSLQPISAMAGGHTLAVSSLIDPQFVTGLGVVRSSGVSVYDETFKYSASATGEGLSEKETRNLTSALAQPSPEVTAVLKRAAIDGSASGPMVDGRSTYRLWAQRIQLPETTGAGSFAYIVGAVNQDASAQAGLTTRNLITMWSVVAVVALVSLGGWVARRVSDPLVELAAGARRIADGDFSTKARVHGHNEIAQLAHSFNSMTDSLRERSETLTKKVLELATLYEMSRSLGSTLDMDELLDSVLESALRIFDLDLGYVVLRDKDSGALPIMAIRGVQEAGSDEAVRSSMSEWVVREGRPLIFNPDINSGAGQIDSVTGAKAALCVPLVSSEGAIGSITIGSSDPHYRFNSDDVRLLSTIANHVTIAVGNIELFSSLQEAYLATVRSLAAAVDAKDSYTRGHSDRVAQFSMLIGENMALSHEQRISLEMAAYLHDIGKIGVAEEILLKPGRLDDDEMEQMKHHPLIGANILKPVAFPWAITPIVRHHHEKWDGNGYPAGLRGEEIPLLARILTVADSYEAMTSDRPYRKGMRADEALEELDRCSGTHFDPKVVAVFAGIVAQGEATGEILTREAEEITPDEARAIFASLMDGVFLSFRRLGGPRLAANVESEIDGYFREQRLPFNVADGRLTFTEDSPPVLDGEVAQMRVALERVTAIIGRLSGDSLMEHFYDDALGGLSVRMRGLASELDFFDA